MPSAKDIRVEPISAKDANRLVRRIHYSGKVVNNSQLHLGAFIDGRLEGAMQFGPSIDKRRLQGLVSNTRWNGFIELNRLAFSELLPRNSESRALAIAFRIMRRQYPHIEWVVSFADAAQCGDGAIYRASGFELTSIKKNKTMLRMPNGSVVADKTLNNTKEILQGRSVGYWKKRGAHPLPGYQLRYIYFLNPAARERLTVPTIPFARIAEMGASMYRGEARPKQATADTIGTAAGQHRPGRSNMQAGASDDYDPGDNARKCYDTAIAALRERHEAGA